MTRTPTYAASPRTSGRRQGAGRLLLDTIVAWAAEQSTRYVALGVTLGDTPATRLYARAGFRPVGEPGPLRPGSPVLGQPMRLDVRPERGVPPGTATRP